VADPDPHLVVVGASLAGLRAVEGARRSGYRGAITLIGNEERPPYDRPPLSKDFLTADETGEPPWLRAEHVLRDELEVVLRLGTTATALDTAGRAVVTDSGTYPYTALVLATGASPRNLPGADSLSGVHVLRTYDDARRIRDALREGCRVVVVGAGFIGSEIAASARSRGAQVTVVEALEAPLARPLGAHMGGALCAMHERHGTRLIVGVGVETLEGEERVSAVHLADGSTLDTDLVVVGVGVTPNVGWLADSGLALADGVACDETLWTGAEGVYAAGDIASWPNPTFGTRMRLEHWTIAAEQGAAAGRHAVDPSAATPFATVPYFWSDWYGHRIQFVGVADEADDVAVVFGDAESDSFVALYRRGDALIGALALEQRSQVMKYRAMLAARASWQDALAFAKERAARATAS
jgi:NADPH-dependent 2,4-dienoyl-CoA reductase/sulfur reductase-like enzyme